MKHTSVFLRHMLDEIVFLGDIFGKKDYESFLRDEVLKRAVARSLEIIGEAAKHIPDEFRAQYPQVDWKTVSVYRIGRSGAQSFLLGGTYEQANAGGIGCIRSVVYFVVKFCKQLRKHHYARTYQGGGSNV
jgi:hypothetical protein